MYHGNAKTPRLMQSVFLNNCVEPVLRYVLAMIYLRLLEVLFLGFLCGMIPGPVVTSIFTETIRKGWKSARRIIFWAAAGELVMSITCVLFFSLLSPDSVVFSALSLFGALILLNLSWDLWKVEEISEEEPLFSRKRVFFISLLNGMAWIFWITVCTPQAISMGKEIPLGSWVFIFLFELGWSASTLALCFLFGLFRSYFQNNKQLHLLYRLIAALFLFFAVKLAYASARVFLH